jgi:hypothetical protein
MICTETDRLEVKGSVIIGDVELPPTPEGKRTSAGSWDKRQAFRGQRSRAEGTVRRLMQSCFQLRSQSILRTIYAASLQRPALVYLGVREEPNTGEVRAAAGVFAEPLPGCPEENNRQPAGAQR